MVCDPETSRRNGAKSQGPITERGKAIASRNATKHGLLAQKPPILVSEDLESFQGIVQGLVEQYQPEGPLEWHYIQTIAMCIQRQHRVWAAEAAVSNAELLPPVPEPYTDKKYPTQKSLDIDFGTKTDFHPDNLALERKLLTCFLKRYPLESFPAGLRSKYWAETWEEWQQSIGKDLEKLRQDYPVDLGHIQDDQVFQDALRELNEANHPFVKILLSLSRLAQTDCPSSKYAWENKRSQFKELLMCFEARLQKIEEIEREIADEKERYQQETEERRLATVNLIPEQIALISRYESHIAKQLKEAITQLSELQSQRKI